MMYLLKPVRQMDNTSNGGMLMLCEPSTASKKKMSQLQQLLYPNTMPRVSPHAMSYLVLVVSPQTTLSRTPLGDHP
jgi:hypothetical protein